MKRLNANEIVICNNISKRAIELGVYTEEEKLVTLRDIIVTAEAREMNITEWLNASDTDFIDDMKNIKDNIDMIDNAVLKFATI